MTANTAQKTVPETMRPVLRKPNNSRLSEASYKRTQHYLVVELGTEPADLLNSSYWTNIADRLKPFDRVEVVCEDGSWYAEYLVVVSGRLWAKVKQLAYLDLAADVGAPPEDGLHTVEWKGPIRKYTVIRKSDKEALKDGFQTREEANGWLDGHIRTLAA